MATARSGLSAGLERAGAVALVVVAEDGRDPDLAPFVGAAHLGASFLIAPAGGRPWLGYLSAMERDEAAATGWRLLTPESLEVGGMVRAGLRDAELWTEILRRALAQREIRPGRVALGGRFPGGTLYTACRALAEDGWEFIDGTPLLRLLRKRKTAQELEAVRRSAAGVQAAQRKVAELLAGAVVRDGELWLSGERLTAGRLRAAAATVFAAHGLEQPRGNIVAAGAEAGVPHTQGHSDRVLRAAESLIVDLYPRGLLFADCTRTFCVGEAPGVLRSAHAEVSRVLEAAHRGARPGATGFDLQEAACRQFEAAGYPSLLSSPDTVVGYVHSLGHGVGYALHELPAFRRDSGEEGQLEVGDVLTLEPGLYDPAAGFGVRLEDLCWLGPDGVENLTPLPYELDPRAW